MIKRQRGFGAGSFFIAALLVGLAYLIMIKSYYQGLGSIGKLSIWIAETKGIPKIGYSPTLSGMVDVSCKNNMIAWKGEIPKVATTREVFGGASDTIPINQDLPAATLMQRSGKVTCSIQNKSAEKMIHGAFGIYLSRDGQNVSKRPDRFHPVVRELAPGAVGETSFELKDFEGVALIYVGANPFKTEMEHSHHLWQVALTKCGKYPNGGTQFQLQQHNRCTAPLWKSREDYGKALQEKIEAARNESVPISSIN